MSNDLWRTPPEVIDYIENRFGKIKIDLCASENNSIADKWLDESDDFLNDAWVSGLAVNVGGLCFCNPPYSNPLPFVKQCIKLSSHGYGVFMLLNNDSSTKWFLEIEHHSSMIMPIISGQSGNGRIPFLGADGLPANGNNKPQIMVYFAPFGRAGDLQTKYISIDEIYPNGKPSKRDAKNEKRI